MNTRIPKISSILLLALLSIACAGTKDFIALPEQAKANISSSDFLLIHEQNELNAEVARSDTGKYASVGVGLIPGIGILAAAADGGALGAMDASIEASRAKKTEQLITPIRSELTNFNITEALQEKITPIISSTSWLKMQNFAVNHGSADNILKQAINTSQSDVIGIIKPYYTLDEKLATLKMLLDVELYPLNPNLVASSKKKKQDSEIKPIYKTKIKCDRSLPVKSKSPTKNAKLWANDNGKEIKFALNQSIAEIVSKMATELNSTDRKI